MRLTTKYPLTIVTMALAAALVTGVVAYQVSKKELRLAAERQSIEILESRKAALRRYLKSIEQDLSLLASNRFAQDALTDFSHAWARLQGNPEQILQKLYIHDNPHPTGEKEKLDQADDPSLYSTVHGRNHPWFRRFLEERGYYDIFLFDTSGNLVYTVFKELDYATNFTNGRWRGTDLGRAFRTTVFNLFPEFQAFFDFKPYEPSHGAPASFIATPVFNDKEDFIGVLAFQMPIGRINDIMQVSAGMGKTGRAYLVGQDLLVRNDSRFSSATEILKTKKSADIVHTAMEGVTGIRELTDDRGTDILVTYTSIGFAGQVWAIITEIELAEVLAPVDDLRRFMMLAGLIIGLTVTVLGVWFSANLSRPIVAMTGIMQRLAKRDLDVDVPASGRADEIGEMEKALEVFKENALQRKVAEAALQESEQRFKTILDNMPAAVYLRDRDGRYILINQAYKEIYQITDEEVYGKTVHDLLPAEQAQEFASQDRQVIDQGDFIEFEAVVTQNDEAKFLTTIKFPIRDHRGNIEAVGGVDVDITEQKHAEAAIAEKEAQLRLALDNLPGGICMLDAGLNIALFNEQYPALMRYGSETFQVGRSIGDSIRAAIDDEVRSAEDADAIIAERLERLGAARSGESERIFADGDAIRVRYNALADGSLVLVATDITESRRAAQKIEENEALLRNIMDHIAQGVVAFNADRQLLSWNENYRQILAFPKSLLRPGQANEKMALHLAKKGTYGDGDPVALSKARIEQLWKKDGSTRIEMTTQEGGVYDVWSAKTPDHGLVITYTDIAERKRAEEELHEARIVAEEATRAKSSFLATMSHEIRTPMNGLMSMAELLNHTALSEEQQSMSTIIRESGAALLVIINDILDFSKIEAGKMDLEVVDLSLIDLVESVAHLLAPQASEKGLGLSAFVDPALPDHYQGDPTRLRQILLNLAGNAVKFTDKGSVSIDIAAARKGKVKSALAFRITDTGIGLSDDQQQKLFQPFQQADASTARKFGGTGLGLTICLRLVEMMGGEIGVDSEPGKGSVFWFEVPLLASSPGPLDNARDLSDARVMTVGKDTNSLGVAERYLTYWGAETEFAATSASALEILSAAAEAGRPFDVVLIDHAQMENDGLALGQEVLTDPQLENTKPVFLAPYGSRTLRDEAQALGFFGSLKKPLARAMLWQTVGAALGLVSKEEFVSQEAQEYDGIAPPDVEDARAAGTLILVAEDNPTNQVVISKLLDKLGFAAEIADNGAVAFDMLGDHDYGLLLTDCHMPEMDGYELTTKIRAHEQAGGRRLPIVALTADALADTEKTCLDAGMDGYLSKPVELAKLEAAIVRQLPKAVELRRQAVPEKNTDDAPQGEPETETDAETDENGLAVLNLEMILFAFDGLNDEVRDMLAEFVKENRQRIGQFQDSVKKADYKSARELAHAMKGAANTIGAHSFGQLSADIEDSLKNENPEGAEVLEPGLEPAFERLERAIANL